MAIVAIRIDGRLLHGQVANMWVNVINPSRIMIVDDEVAASDIAKASIKLAKPSGLNLSILNEQRAIQNITEGRYDSQQVFLLVRRPKALLDLINGGVPIDTINVGNMSQSDGSKALTNSINVLQDDVDAFNDLLSKDIKITSQMVPSDPVVNFKTLLEKY